MPGISLGLGLPERFFEEDRAGDSYWCMRIIHYPPLLAAEAPSDVSLPVDGEIERSTQLSCGEHTDYGAMQTRVRSTECVHCSDRTIKPAAAFVLWCMLSSMARGK